MPTLGVTVTQRSTPPSRGQFSQTGTAFKVGLADLGPIGVAKKLQSIGDFILWYGARVTANQVFYDAVDVAFQEGANVVWAARAVGPSKAYDTINLAAVSGTSLVWTANDPGVSGVKVQVTNGTDSTTRIVIVSNAATGAVIAQTAQFSDKTATPPLGTLGGGTLTAGGGSGLPVVAAATAPTGGSSDNAKRHQHAGHDRREPVPQELRAGQHQRGRDHRRRHPERAVGARRREQPVRPR
jgi:hypothetical protein